MERNSNKVPIGFPPVSEFFNYPPLVRLEILTTFSLSNMIEYLTRALHPSNRYSNQVTHGLQPPEEAINTLILTANEEMLDEFLNRNINFNLMCYLTAQNKRARAVTNGSNPTLTNPINIPQNLSQRDNYSPFEDMSMAINLSPPSSASSCELPPHHQYHYYHQQTKDPSEMMCRIPDRDDYLELLKIWYSYPRVSEMAPNWFFDSWNKNFFFSHES